MSAAVEKLIFVVDYNPSWPDTFEALRRPIWAAVSDAALSVEHVGSTAVPGLAAKPIIDMDVIVVSRVKIAEVIARLAPLGYVHAGDLGVEDRAALRSPEASPAHHLYVCLEGSAALTNHLTLRNFLRRNPVAAAEYGRLKKQLAEHFPTDVDSYIAAKTEFIVGALRNSGFPDSVLRAIRDANLRPAAVKGT